MKNIFLLTLFFLYSIINLQAQDDLLNDYSFECGMVEITDFGDSKLLGTSSTNGHAFRPHGDLRVLVVYANWEFDGYNALNNPLAAWPFGETFPTDHIGINGEILWGHDNPSDFSPINNPSPDANDNLSEFFYHMSEGDFRVYFETLKDSQGWPTNVKIDPTQYSNEGQINQAIFEKIRIDYPQNWSRFNLQKDPPIWQINNTDSKKIDYIILIYRNDNTTWANAPINSQGTAAAGNFYSSYDLGNSYKGGYGVKWINFGGDRNGLISILIHEMSHGYYYAPHYGLANKVHGKYFYGNYGWGQMSGYGNVSTISNSWERWYSGWIDIRHDVNEINTNVSETYNLRDYMSYGDAMRIKLPHTDDQYIWLEHRSHANHQFYQRNKYFVDGQGNPIPQQSTGLYGYIERMASDTTSVNRFGPAANGMKIISGSKHYDYKFNGFYVPPYYWGNSVIKLTRGEENPYGGQNDGTVYRFDENLNQIIDWTSNSNGGGANEGREIVEVDDEPIFGRLLTDIVLPNQKLSAFTNPPLSNFQELDPIDNTLSPIILHSLSITSSSGMNNTKNILVNYNDGHIENNFRMTGNIYLPSNEDITLDPSKHLTINRSKTANKRIKEGNSFTDYTAFKAAENSSFSMATSSKLFLDESSTMIFDSYSELNMDSKATIYIRNGSLLCIKEFANVNLNSLAKIVVEDGYLYVHPSINISNNVIYGNNFPFPQISNTVNYCSVTNNPEHLHSISGTVVNGTCISQALNLNVNDKVKLTSENFIQINQIFNAPIGSYFEAEISKPQEDCDIEFSFKSDIVAEDNIFENKQRDIKDSTKEEIFAIKVFPNPSNDIFNVELSEELDYVEYALYNMQGSVIENNNFKEIQYFSISSDNLETGMYLLKIFNEKHVVTKKIFKY